MAQLLLNHYPLTLEVCLLFCTMEVMLVTLVTLHVCSMSDNVVELNETDESLSETLMD